MMYFRWDGLSHFLSLPRRPLHYCDSAIYCSKQIRAYVRSYKNFAFYWILQAGHMVSINPYVSLLHIAYDPEGRNVYFVLDFLNRSLLTNLILRSE